MDWKPGDVFACFGADRVSRIISAGTFRPFAPRGLRLGPSHVAMCCNWRNSPVWVESTTFATSPCLVRGEVVAGCQAHPIGQRLADYLVAGGRVDLYRLVAIDRFTDEESARLADILVNGFVNRGIGYDYGGALISGTRVLKRLSLGRLAGLESVFCSELLAATLMRLCRLNRKNATRYNPGALVRRLVRDGTYRFVESFRSIADVDAF